MMWAIRALEAVKHICIVGLIMLGFAGAIFVSLYVQGEAGTGSLSEQEDADMMATAEAIRPWVPWIAVAVVVVGVGAVYTYRRVKDEPADDEGRTFRLQHERTRAECPQCEHRAAFATFNPKQVPGCTVGSPVHIAMYCPACFLHFGLCARDEEHEERNRQARPTLGVDA